MYVSNQVYNKRYSTTVSGWFTDCKYTKPMDYQIYVSVLW